MSQRILLLLLCGLSLALPIRARALVTEGDMPPPENGYVGSWSGASGVPIASRWILTLNHIGGGIGSGFWLDNQVYLGVEYHQYMQGDLVLVKLDRDLPAGHWHRLLRRSLEYGETVTLGGYGEYRAAPLAGNAGYQWSGERALHWGRNILGGVSLYLAFGFSRPTDPDAVPFEAQGASGDSGGGVFVTAPDGQLELAGLMQSISGGFNQAHYGDATFAANLEQYLSWIDGIVPGLVPPTPTPSSTPTLTATPTSTPVFVSAPVPTPTALPAPEPRPLVKASLSLQVTRHGKNVTLETISRVTRPRTRLAAAGTQCQLLIYLSEQNRDPLLTTPAKMRARQRFTLKGVGLLRRGQRLQIKARLQCLERTLESQTVTMRGANANGLSSSTYRTHAFHALEHFG